MNTKSIGPEVLEPIGFGLTGKVLRDLCENVPMIAVLVVDTHLVPQVSLTQKQENIFKVELHQNKRWVLVSDDLTRHPAMTIRHLVDFMDHENITDTYRLYVQSLVQGSHVDFEIRNIVYRQEKVLLSVGVREQIADRHTMVADRVVQAWLEKQPGWTKEKSKGITFRNIQGNPYVPEWIQELHQFVLKESVCVDKFFSIT